LVSFIVCKSAYLVLSCAIARLRHATFSLYHMAWGASEKRLPASHPPLRQKIA